VNPPSRSSRVVILPPVPALLPSYLGQVDPVSELRTACRTAVSWLLDGWDSAIAVLADPLDPSGRQHGVEVPLGVRVARSLLDEAGYQPPPHQPPASGERRLLVLANGSGCRSEKAPGYLDPRSFPFDERIETALADGDRASLAGLDASLGRDLLAIGIEPLRQLGAMDLHVAAADLRYVGDPYGVRYWVATWICGPGSQAGGTDTSEPGSG
jgi:hypothetical protein